MVVHTAVGNACSGVNVIHDASQAVQARGGDAAPCIVPGDIGRGTDNPPDISKGYGKPEDEHRVEGIR